MEKVVILGAGESGVGSAVLAGNKGFEVFVSDSGIIKDKYCDELNKHNIAYEFGGHTEEKILSADIVIKSPGIRNDSELIKKIEQRNIPVLSEIEFAGRYTNAKMICITGSNGKTTTTKLTYKILKDAGFNVGLGGNVGKSFARQVATENYDYYVLELSSFQLDNMYDFKSDIAVLLNITPDHLDRYDNDMQKYADSKFRIIRNQTKDDVFIYFDTDPVTSKEIAKRDFNQILLPISVENKPQVGAYYDENNNVVLSDGKNVAKISSDGFQLIGIHNRCNIMAVGLIALHLGVDSDSIKSSINNFLPLEHRFEFVTKFRGVKYINDSKATNVDAVRVALESIDTDKKNVVLILGGVDKGNDYTLLDSVMDKKVKSIIIFANELNTKIIYDAFKSKNLPFYKVNNIDDTIKTAIQNSNYGDTVLFAPGGTSFDYFHSYKERGEVFKNTLYNQIEFLETNKNEK